MRNLKPGSKLFESKREYFWSGVSLGALALVAAAALGFSGPAAMGAFSAMRELKSTYKPEGDMVSTRKTPMLSPQMADIVSRMVEPGIDFTVADGLNGQKAGIEVSAKVIGSMQDFKAWRHGIDAVMLALPGWQWETVKLCAGTGCDKNTAAYALLTASRMDLDVSMSIAASPTPRAAAALEPPVGAKPPAVQLKE